MEEDKEAKKVRRRKLIVEAVSLLLWPSWVFAAAFFLHEAFVEGINIGFLFVLVWMAAATSIIWRLEQSLEGPEKTSQMR